MAADPHARRLPSAVAVVSDFAFEEARACWEIRGFSLVDRLKDSSMESGPLLKVGGARFGLRAYWGGKAASSHDHFALYCCREEGDEAAEAVKACVGISVVSRAHPQDPLANLNRCFPTVKLFPSSGPETVLGWTDFGKLSDLLVPWYGYLVEDTVVVELHVKAFVAARTQRTPSAPSLPGANVGAARKGSERRLADDLVAFLTSGQATDVEVHGSLGDCDEAVRAHRVVMAARSPVFKRMLLASGMRECAVDAKVCLEGADADVAARFVRFLYTNELDSDSTGNADALCHLLALAHRYEVKSLLECCTAQLTVSLTEETAIERLIMAEQLGIPVLKEHVKEYICSCRARLAQVQTTEAFPRMNKNYPHLLMEIFAEVFPPARKRARSSAPEDSAAAAR